jgi:hypothetical protein
MSTHQSLPKTANAKKKSDILPKPAQSKSHPVIAQPKIESTRSNEEQLAQMRANREASERLGTTLLTPESVARTRPPVQPKLTIGQPNDQYEQEADRVARQVVDHINAPPKIQAKTQRYPMSVAQRKPSPLAHHPVSRVQRYATGGEMDASPDLESSIQRARGGGHPLDNGIRARMEGAFGADFSGVRVHTDGTSDQLNQSIQAKAFTTGQDVFFRKGAYNPGSRGGQELLAHELTHVVQQKGKAVQRKTLTDKSDTISTRFISQTDTGKAVVQCNRVKELIGKFESKGKTQVTEQRSQNEDSGQKKVKGLRNSFEETARQESEALNSKRDFVKKKIVRATPIKGGAVNEKLYKITFNFGVQKAPDGSLKKVQGTSLWFFKPIKLINLTDDDNAPEELDADGYPNYEDRHPNFSLVMTPGDKIAGEGLGIPGRNPRIAERNVAAYEMDKLLGGDTIVASFIVDSLEIPGKEGKVRGLLMQGASGQEASKIKANQLRKEKLTSREELRGLDLEQFDLNTQLAFSRLSLLDIIIGNFDRHVQNFFIGKGNVTGIDNDLIFGKLFGKKMLDDTKGKSDTYAGYYPADLPIIDGYFAERIIQLDPESAKQVLENNFKGKIWEKKLIKMQGVLVERLEWLKAELNKEEIRENFMNPDTLEWMYPKQEQQ